MLFICKLGPNETKEAFFNDCSLGLDEGMCQGVTECYAQDDLEAFQNALRKCQAYIPQLVQAVHAFLTEQCQMSAADLLLGCLCFEVHAV